MFTKKIREHMLKLANEEGVVDRAQLAERTYAYLSELIGNYEKDEYLRRIPLHVLISKLSRAEYEIAEIMNEMFDRKIIGGFKAVKVSKKDEELTKKDVGIKGSTTVFSYSCMLIELED